MRHLLSALISSMLLVQVSFAQSITTNEPGPDIPPSQEMKTWLEFLGGTSNGTESSEALKAPRKAIASWSYPSSAPATPFGGGSGTKTDPYIVSTAQHLANFAYKVNNGSSYSGVYFKMTTNIVLNCGVLKADGSLGSGSYQSWTPIGNSSYSFKGNFDGGGHYVSGIYINSTTSNYLGLFGRSADGTISNLGVEDSYICGNDYVAGILGHSDHTSLSSCYNAATVVAHFDVGGIVGDDCGSGGSSYSVSSSSITACANYGLITASKSCVGGIIGFGNESVTVTYCINYAKITGTGDNTGGIVGQPTSKISNCANTGNISITGSGSSYGAISGGGSATNCYYLAGTCSQAGGGTSKSATQFADGTVLSLLDPSGTYFKQGNNGLPVLKNIHRGTSDYGSAPVGIEVIDLGLPSGTLWANMNVGATKTTEIGSYYGWGGLTANSTSYSSSTTYSSDIDAATVNWGSSWRMPSEEQLQELIDQCTWTYVTNYQGASITGMELTGPNGNKLFLPTTGTYSSQSNGWGNYWSSSVVSSSAAKSLAFETYKSTVEIYQSRSKSVGQMIRPIYTGAMIMHEVETTDISKLSYAIYSDEAKGKKNSYIALTVNMKNTQPITLWQADVTLPSGFSMANDDYGEAMVYISGGRTTHHSIATSKLSDGSIRILCSSNGNKTFSGTDGEVATIILNTANSVGNGEYAVNFKNILLVEADESRHKVEDIVSRITIKNYTLGDVNDDGKIDGVDLVGIVNYILETPKSGNIREAADVNKDGVIDGTDYVREVNVILGNLTLPATARGVKKDAEAADEYAIYANDITADAGSRYTLRLFMKNVQPITLWQTDLVLPEGVSIATDEFGDPMVAITGRTTTARHSIATSTLTDGAIRILCSSSNNKAFSGNDGEVATITLVIDGSTPNGVYDVVLKNILLVEADETKHISDQESIKLTVNNTSAGTKCATPTISYADGKLMFNCQTDGVEYVYEFKDADIKKGNSSEVSLTATYEISVYATKACYDNSDVATATIHWRNGKPLFEGFSNVTLEPTEDACDVNGDGEVGIGDIVSITNVMAGSTKD